jgi:hypothetical protein
MSATRTYAMIEAILPHDIAQIVYRLFAAPKEGKSNLERAYNSGRYGCWEEVDGLSSSEKLHAIWGAARSNYITLAVHLAKAGVDPDFGLWGAARRGSMRLVRRMIFFGATDWTSGMHDACKGGHHDIMRLMIDKGAIHCPCGRPLAEHLATEGRDTEPAS